MSKKRLVFFITLLSFVALLFVANNFTNVKAQTVNDYIISNRIQPSQIKNQEGTFSHWFGYENGVGKPEGVVVHETADDHLTANAANEASYFNGNWNLISAYVHAFVDDQQIINIHNTDYGVWGAGETANAKYVQVELCHTHTYDAFARSIANDAYYVADKLIQYNLPDTPGKTVVSHDQVSHMYHETDHTDPVGYFSNWGYSMDSFNDMVGYYYKNLKNYRSVYPAASTNASNNGGVIDKSVIKVNNASGTFVPLVAISNNSVATAIPDRALANNSAWQTDQTKQINGVTYHRVATNEWVAAKYIVK